MLGDGLCKRVCKPQFWQKPLASGFIVASEHWHICDCAFVGATAVAIAGRTCAPHSSQKCCVSDRGAAHFTHCMLYLAPSFALNLRTKQHGKGDAPAMLSSYPKNERRRNRREIR
jgi:hypothetical protein